MKTNLQALVKRINRKMADRDEKLCKSRGTRTQLDLGDYYIIDLHRNVILLKHVDQEQLAQELGVLRPVPMR